MNSNILPTSRAPIMAVIDPDVLTAGDHSSGWVDATKFANLAAVVMAGTLGASATFDAKIEEAKDSSGTDAQDLSGKAITQLTQAGTDESDKQAIINVNNEELSDGFTHIRLTITVGTASSDGGGFIQGFDARYEPATEATTVAEIIS